MLNDEKIDEITNFLQENIKKFEVGKKLDFKDIVKSDTNYRGRRGVLEYPGCYVIYENDKAIYVGSAGKGTHVLKYRMGDLFNKSREKYYHTLTRKLINHKEHKSFDNIKEVRKFYLKKCYLKVIKTDTVEQARLLESALILLLKPRYNA